ncbi:MAG TPA: hypothetical protein PLK45_02410 [Paludibacteraceae bacterium]|nr:hypothetical protein [Paludibacteraceae bacterium]HPO47636.1 hypothetical protein [Paludibacteraceae bacterium]
MTKETLIILIEKEITEIISLTKGFAELDTFPKPLMEMALEKSKNLTKCLDQLANLKEKPQSEKVVIEPQPKAETPQPIETVQEPKKDEKQTEKVVAKEKEKEIIPPQSEPKVILAETIKKTTSVLENLATNGDRVASVIEHQKITELKSAISIADRFRFQRELFEGNGEQMSQAISDFDNMDSMEAALAYITQKFKWDEADTNVADFMDLLQRRYL